MGIKGVAGLIVASLSLLPISTAVAQPAGTPAVDQSLLPYANRSDVARLPDGRTIHLVCMGQGSPVVILTAGAGNWSITWNKVQPAVAQKTRVCAWDRPGFGFSAPSPKPATVDNTTTDLQDALKAAGIAGPYIAVGHSLGGYESVLLKDREPSKVIGMVLVDPSFPGQYAAFERATPNTVARAGTNPPPFIQFLQKCAAALRAGTLRYGDPDPDGCLHPQWPPDYPPELRAALSKGPAEAAPATVASAMETMAFYGSPKQLELDSRIVVRPSRNYGAMPLIVLTAADMPSFPDDPPAVKAETPAMQAAWRKGHDGYAALSTRGVNRIVEGSSHDIQQIKPQVVIDAIDEVVDEVRDSAKAGR
jgi:pimeloyl-ACP methyl ester carboxylesterase